MKVMKNMKKNKPIQLFRDRTPLGVAATAF